MRTFSFRPLIFWPHLILGIAAGAIILVMSVTGVLLTYQRQMITWAERDYRHSGPTTGVPRLSSEAILSAVSAAYPGTTPSSLTFRRDPAAPVAVAISGGKTISVNPYTGAILGEGALKTRAFFRAVTNWHRWLALEGASRTTARAVTGAANLIFLLLALSGLYLWWPRAWKWSAVKNVVLFRRGVRGKSRDFNWHNVFGFWMALPIAIVAASGVVISYPWAGNLVYRLAGEKPPAPSSPASSVRSSVQGSVQGPVDAFVNAGILREPEWQTVALRLPIASAAVLTIDRGNGGQPHLKSTLTLDASTGTEQKFERFADQTRGRRWRTWMRWMHTGEAGGWLGQTLAGIASFAGVMLVYSGFLLSWRRFFGRRVTLATQPSDPSARPVSPATNRPAARSASAAPQPKPEF